MISFYQVPDHINGFPIKDSPNLKALGDLSEQEYFALRTLWEKLESRSLLISCFQDFRLDSSQVKFVLKNIRELYPLGENFSGVFNPAELKLRSIFEKTALNDCGLLGYSKIN